MCKPRRICAPWRPGFQYNVAVESSRKGLNVLSRILSCTCRFAPSVSAHPCPTDLKDQDLHAALAILHLTMSSTPLPISTIVPPPTRLCSSDVVRVSSELSSEKVCIFLWQRRNGCDGGFSLKRGYTVECLFVFKTNVGGARCVLGLAQRPLVGNSLFWERQQLHKSAECWRGMHLDLFRAPVWWTGSLSC